MTSSFNLLIAGVLMFSGLAIGGTGAFTQAESQFAESHPTDNDWNNDGTLDNTISDNGVLRIDNTTDGYGTFDSYLFQPGEKVSVDRVVYNASNIRETKDRVINITVYGFDGEAIEEQTSFLISSNDKRSVDDIFECDTCYDGYAYRANLTTTDSESPELNSLTVYGNEAEGTSMMSYAIMWLLFGFGLLMAGREF